MDGEGGPTVIIDTEKVKKVLFDTSVGDRTIQKETGFPKGSLYRYRKGLIPIEKMQIGHAKTLQDYYDKIEKEKSG